MTASRTIRRFAPHGHRKPDPATRRLARGLGRPDDATLIRLYGAREIVQEIGILDADDPTPWIWARVGGDAMDIATVMPALSEENSERGNALITLVALAGVTALDIVCARNLARAPRASS